MRNRDYDEGRVVEDTRDFEKTGHSTSGFVSNQ